ncbi:MAG TPA: putative manganese-dependent inorganic diphosphatase [Clostridiales bacterium]|nr:putative manganese-dependent inorganic diphosphatase [Clostridiales bacterium]
MNGNKKTQRKINVIGHKNPDTDSICSAIAYANLKNLTSDREYEPRRAGEINQETAFVLKTFDMKPPRICLDVHAKVRDIDIRCVDGIDRNMTLRRAWETMRDQDITTLPVTNSENQLEGLITLRRLAMANMDSLDPHAVANAHTPISNIVETLNGTLVTGSNDMCIDHGKIVIAAGSPEAMETMVEPGDIVLVANRYEAQLCAIELEAACLVVCMTPNIAKTIVKLAQEHNCTLISTPYDTYAASCLINQSIPICHPMVRSMILFQMSTPVEEAKKIMGEVRHNYFPVVDKDGRYQGVISRRNLLNLQRKQLVLVDHNEKTQCVEGYEDAEILEIIDHHRIGSLETNGPVYFRNQPVGCTATIVYQMYCEYGLDIEPSIAGILCSAILSDTLIFRSPTCTPTDVYAARQLAKIAGIDAEEYAKEMFEAGENLDGKTPEQVLLQDYKIFVSSNTRFGVGQGSYVSSKNRAKAKEMLSGHLQEVLAHENIDMIFYLVTDILEQSSEILFAGKDAAALLERSFHCPVDPAQPLCLAGVVSRKKQFIPALINTLQNL